MGGIGCVGDSMGGHFVLMHTPIVIPKVSKVCIGFGRTASTLTSMVLKLD